MRYYKQIEGDYIVAIGTGLGGVEISEEEYNTILGVIKDKPQAEEGYDYILKVDLTWEKIEVPIVEPDADEADYINTLERLGL